MKVSDSSLYKLFLSFMCLVAKKVKVCDIIRVLKINKDIDKNALDYFTLVGLNMLAEDIEKENNKEIVV